MKRTFTESVKEEISTTHTDQQYQRRRIQTVQDCQYQYQQGRIPNGNGAIRTTHSFGYDVHDSIPTEWDIEAESELLKCEQSWSPEPYSERYVTALINRSASGAASSSSSSSSSLMSPSDFLSSPQRVPRSSALSSNPNNCRTTPIHSPQTDEELSKVGLLLRNCSNFALQRLAFVSPEKQLQYARAVDGWMKRDPLDQYGKPASWDTRLNFYLKRDKVPTLREWLQQQDGEVAELNRQIEARIVAKHVQTCDSSNRTNSINLDLLRADGDPTFDRHHSLIHSQSDSIPQCTSVGTIQSPPSHLVTFDGDIPFEPPNRWRELYAMLTSNQRQAVDAFKSGRNVFLTGSGGCGKSFVIEAILEWLRSNEKCGQESCKRVSEETELNTYTESFIPCRCYDCSVRVIGPTGLCVLPFRGCTINSFLAVGMGHKLALWDMWPPVGFLHRRILEARYLIIEEVSMVSGEVFDLIDQRLRLIRHKPDQPFGGIQLLVTGDFAQLPPVEHVSHDEKEIFDCEEVYRQFRDAFRSALRKYFQFDASAPLPYYPSFRRTHKDGSANWTAELKKLNSLYWKLPVRGWGYAFDANAWQQLRLESIQLIEPMRFIASKDSHMTEAEQAKQTHHPKVLNQLRIGDLSSIHHFDACVRSLTPHDQDDDVLHLVYTNAAAKLRNLRQLQKKSNKEAPIYAYRHLTLKTVLPLGSFSSSQAPVSRESSPPSSATSGSDVDLLALSEPDSSPDAELDKMADERILLCLGAPVILTRNIDMTLHKSVMLANGSRGKIIGWQPVELAIADIKRHIEHTRALLSNAPASKKESLSTFIAQLEKKIVFLEAGTNHLPDVLPIVRFIGMIKDATGNYPSRDEVILPVVSELKGMIDTDQKCIVHKWRFQLPLKLGWSITVHKSQGMSLDSAFIDNSRSPFAFGQLYVALSRVRMVDRLYLSRKIDSATFLGPAPKVVQFYNAPQQVAPGPRSNQGVSWQGRIDWMNQTSHQIYAQLGGQQLSIKEE